MCLRTLSTSLILVLVSSAALAQSNLDVELQEEIRREDSSAAQVQVQPSKPASQEARQAQGVVIVNSNQNQSEQLQQQRVLQQPTTYVEASPLGESRAEALRRSRQSAEIETEQKIVEKLENSRLEDEKRRAERLFGDRLNTQPEVQPTPAVAPAPVPTPAPAPQTAEPAKVIIEKVEIIHPEPAPAVVEAKVEPEQAKEHKSTMYIGAGLGMADYVDVNNVESNYATGIVVGTELDNNIMVEGLFNYSNYYVDEYWRYPTFRELDQYDIGLNVKYSFLPGKVKPFAGVGMSYIYRKYNNRYDNTYSYSYNNPYYTNDSYYLPDDKEVTTNAVDISLLAGVDVLLGEKFSIGADFRYSFNMINKSDSDYFGRRNFAPANTTPIEELEHYTLLITGKIRF